MFVVVGFALVIRKCSRTNIKVVVFCRMRNFKKFHILHLRMSYVATKTISMYKITVVSYYLRNTSATAYCAYATDYLYSPKRSFVISTTSCYMHLLCYFEEFGIPSVNDQNHEL